MTSIVHLSWSTEHQSMASSRRNGQKRGQDGWRQSETKSATDWQTRKGRSWVFFFFICCSFVSINYDVLYMPNLEQVGYKSW